MAPGPARVAGAQGAFGLVDRIRGMLEIDPHVRRQPHLDGAGPHLYDVRSRERRFLQRLRAAC